jgi:predicted metal-dependent phosphoesterase TrpH
MGLADLHLHTRFSHDGIISVPAVLARARRIGLGVIAITDHDEIRGSLHALELAPGYGVEVIPGIEISTAEGDLLALDILEKVDPGLPLIDTVLQVQKLGGFCVAPHPMSVGLGMRSLSAYSILRALRSPEVAQTLIGIEIYNATTIDKLGNHYAEVLSQQLEIATLGSSDAHVIRAIGLGATEFEGHTAQHLRKAIRKRKTRIHKTKEWNSARILGSWAVNYLGRAFTRFARTT